MRVNKAEESPHIVMLAPFFPPYKGAVSSRLESFARYWTRFATVTVITTEASKEPETYRRIVIPLAKWRFDFLKMPYRFPALLRQVKRISPDILFASIPPVWPLLEAHFLSKRLGLPLTVDVRDLPTSTYPIDKVFSVRRGFNLLAQTLSRYLLRKKRGAVTVTECVLDQLREFADISGFKGWVIRNGSEIEHFKRSRTAGKKYDIVYSGTFILVRNPKSIFKYLLTLRELFPQVKVLFLVDFVDKKIEEQFRTDLKKHSMEENVDFQDMTSTERIPEFLGRARLGLDSLVSSSHTYKGAVSAKDYEYLAAGLPVVGLIDPDFYVETRRIISDNAVGILDPDPLSLARKTAELLKNPLRLKEMSDKARKVGERFDRKLLAEEYYRKVILPAWRRFSAG